MRRNDPPRLLRLLRLGATLGLVILGFGCGTGTDESQGATEGTSGASTTSEASTGATDSTTTGSTSGGETTQGTTTATTTTTTTSDGTTSSSTDATTRSSTDATSTTGTEERVMGFFVSSDSSKTGDLGGLAGADQRCQSLAEAVGAGGRTWRAYLSVDKGEGDQPVHARDRIGQGPWYNAALVLLASDLDELHALDGDHTLFLDEHGAMVNGQWEGSPTPNEHDILTGSNKDGTLVAGKTCADWTSGDGTLFAQVGHSDGLGPMMNDAEMYRPWNSVHENGGCNDTAPKGGAGKIYCFAAD
ncbi:MAG: hypothetical protein R3B09_09485 [Nannocystaceae bacterium]